MSKHFQHGGFNTLFRGEKLRLQIFEGGKNKVAADIRPGSLSLPAHTRYLINEIQSVCLVVPGEFFSAAVVSEQSTGAE